jgi:eukaryotic-like serine/threonine-protein kinase
MRDLVVRLQEALAGRYSIERELGRGGMATVVLAHDLRHERPVALKVLHPELAASLGTERFAREIRLAAGLQHPHILSVHDSGDAPGGAGEPALLWFTMPYVEGESLRDRLNREGQLPLPEAVQITREVADALDYAHRHGVVHRDVKPENILLSEGHALVADFGVARALGGEVGGGLTGTGMAVGTAGYMSPEQSCGEAVDARTDQYALACVLYEMLAGEPPFAGPTAQAIIARRLTEEPRRLGAARPGLPAAVEGAVTKALARVPADRFTSMAEFAGALNPVGPPARTRRAPLALYLTMGFLLGVGVLFAWRRIQPSEAGGPLLLAVLPFDNLGDSADAYFADGMADEVRDKLAGLPGFQVIARGSARQYRGTSKPLRDVARELGVRYLLTGTVQWVKSPGGDRVQVRPELVEVIKSGATVTKWGKPFDAQLTDLFQVQSRIAGQVAAALNSAISPTAPALAETPTASLPAYDEFLRGEQAYGGSSGPTALREAFQHYQRAVALDSTFARAWGRLSQVSSSLYFGVLPSPGLADTAQRSAERALALSPRLPEAQLAMGKYYTLVRYDYDRAIEAFRAGLAINPAHAELLGELGLAEQGRGRLDAAIDDMRRGLALDPRSLLYTRRLIRALLYAHRLPDADTMSRRALALGPSDAAALGYAAQVRLAQGDLPGARALLHGFSPEADSVRILAYLAANGVTSAWLPDDGEKREVLGMRPELFDNERAVWGLTLAQASLALGDTTRARAYADSALGDLERLVRENPKEPTNHLFLATGLALIGGSRGAEAVREGEQGLAMLDPGDLLTGAPSRHQLIQIYLLTGKYDKALDQLEALMRIPYLLTPAWLRIDPTFDPIRKHPRFQALLAR